MANEQAEPFAGWCNLEEWRPVVGYEGIYDISSHGRVRRIGKAARTGRGRGGGAQIGRVLKPQPNGGYRQVYLWRDGKQKPRLVHCLVAEAFIGPVPPGHEVNHCDGNKTHNWIGNLEYLTRSKNLEHAYRTGLRLVTIDQMVSARRKPRTVQPCACGCGVQLETPDRQGRERRFISGHNMRRAS